VVPEYEAVIATDHHLFDGAGAVAQAAAEAKAKDGGLRPRNSGHNDAMRKHPRQPGDADVRA
jgi:hypothetical protein